MKIISTILILLISIFTVSAQSQIVPILELKMGGLLGGVQDGKFVDAKTAFSGLKKGQEYTIYNLESGISQDVLKINVSAPDAPCEEFYGIETELDERTGIAVGTNAGWGILPREVRKMSLTDKTYLDIISSILKSKGLPNAKARIEQAFRVDLEGDGVDEVVISASSYSANISPKANAGDYSFILLRKIINGKAQNIMISEEYIKKKVEFGAPTEFEISAIADLNGDRRMELVIYDAYYEGSGAAVYEVKDNKINKVLGDGCGV